jgi:hypothetical protein
MITVIEPSVAWAQPDAFPVAQACAPDAEAKVRRLLRMLAHLDVVLEAEIERLNDREADGESVEAGRMTHR